MYIGMWIVWSHYSGFYLFLECESSFRTVALASPEALLAEDAGPRLVAVLKSKEFGGLGA